MSDDYLYVYVYCINETPKWYACTLISQMSHVYAGSEPETMCWAIWRERHRVDPICVSSERACQPLYGRLKDVINIVAETVRTRRLEKNKTCARTE
jgi:hypothetical protein